MPDTVFREYLGVPIAVTESGKFTATVNKRRLERAKVADIEKAIRDEKTALTEPIDSVCVGHYGEITHYAIVGWDAKVRRFVVNKHGQKETISRYNWPLCYPDAEREAQLKQIKAEIRALTDQRDAITKEFKPITLEDLTKTGGSLPEIDGEADEWTR